MHVSHRVASSHCFHQLSRPLGQGEPLPRLPSLTEQLLAYQLELARERAAEHDEAPVEDAGNEWEDDQDDDLV